MFRSKSSKKKAKQAAREEESKRRAEERKTLKITAAEHRIVGRELPDLIRHLRRTGPHPRSLFAATVSPDDVRQAVDGVLESKETGTNHSLAQVCARYPAAVWASVR